MRVGAGMILSGVHGEWLTEFDWRAEIHHEGSEGIQNHGEGR